MVVSSLEARGPARHESFWERLVCLVEVSLKPLGQAQIGRISDAMGKLADYWAVCFLKAATSSSVIRDGLLPKRAVT